MHLVSRLRRIMAMTIVLLGMLAGLGVASAQADAPILTGGGGRQTPRVADGTPGTLHSNATSTPLPSPSPIQATTPLNPASSKPGTPSSTTGTPGSADPTPAKSIEKTDDQATHVVRFDPDNGSKPTQSTVQTGALAAPPAKNPVRDGFQFDGWAYNGQPFDFQTPIIQNMTLKAQWTKTTDWTLSPDHGPATGARLTISPPSLQEPYYISIHTFGDRFVGLTGDGRIYTWKQDSTPEQIPTSAQAPDGFHYLQATAGDQWQAALGSDQHIYTWNSQQPTPTILDAVRNTRFTSISTNDDRLLAVDRQSRVHDYQADQNPNPELKEQAATSLPGQAQAVTATTSSSRTLIVDADGQAWTWDTSNTRKAEPERIKLDPDMRIIQAQALSQGSLLLDTKGQAWYLADSTTAMTPVSLPDGAKASQITANKDQAMITSTDGSLRVWKPGEAPKRADNGNQSYVQATSIGSRVTAISRQGSLYRWSLDGQGQHGEPARLDTTQAPILETASLDSQPLKLTRNNDSSQAQMPAHKPGPATILITGKQDSQPFTRNLNYTVDQPPTRAAEPRSTLTVHFNTGGGKPEPEDQQFSTPYGRVKRPSPDPAREGFLFDGWFIGDVAYDFSKPVDKDLTLTAKWTPNSTWSISPDKGSQLGRESTTITPPDTSRGIRFNQISGGKSSNNSFSLAVGSDGNAYAWGNNTYGQLGDGTKTDRTTPVKVRKPTNAPADFTYVQVSAGWDCSLALGSDGNAYAWGSNTSGQLGDGTTTQRTTPVKVGKPTGLTYVQISAGDDHSLALSSDGNAYAWGLNTYGKLGDGTTTQRTTPVKVGKPTGLTYVQVSAGWQHSLALSSAGNAYAWGLNSFGQGGNGTTTHSQPTPVKVRKPTGKPTDFTYVQVSGGGDHSLAMGSDGYTYAWGYNKYGQLGNGTTSDTNANPVPVRVRNPANPTDTSKGLKAAQIIAGFNHSLALGSDGYTYAWGWNNYGQLGNTTTRDSSVPVRVRDPASPSDASKGLKAVQLSAGEYYSLALGSDGNAYTWGANGNGQLGDGSTNSKSAPVPVSFNLALVITGVRFDQTPVSGLTRGDSNSVTVLTPAHQPGMVTVSVDYTLGGASQTPDTSLRYTYLPAGVLPKAGGEGILLALATGMTGMGGVLASRRHRQETRQLVHASHE
ncbi:RCC1 domain-containing protein [Bifidobacterium kimbladii]|uniref:RCC1 repeat domain protein, 2 domains n=1 Tax=Bifidobacterium asteroides TaxID=1684 RepID=A0A0F4KZY4_9BIFI|nr:InlB B-repeat-containing protein [Bifidobacterium asteroides]KJY51509.1 RCC1 repeat domain protein, 2 domains [Bifidobacterium asteroides]